ncbi:class F sortase [Actinoallomurus rhizosphaericola]|uniref:class F sortase n=1 Tax=Actinoallomurus rhizosphaericola TaxID=2952536 RepID=UPI0020925AA9|nr:class F sortase [Actinoallomurus rhizosphaericola]MCO5997303.1 class F sortase [Actinoallomurus rhizosphaericola]
MTTRPARSTTRTRRARRSVLVTVTALGVVLPGASPAPATPDDGRLRATPGDGPLQATPGDGPLQATPGDGPLQATPGDGPLQATPGDDPLRAARGDGYLRLAHLSPDTPAVDVYLYAAGHGTPRLVLKHVGYGALSPYQRLGGGAYTVAMRPADAAATSPPVLSAHVRVHAGTAYTVAGLGPYKGLTLRVLEDTRTAPAGGVALRVVQASLRRPAVTVTVGASTVAGDLRFPDVSAYRSVRAGVTTVRVTGGSGAPVRSRVTLRAGSVHTLVVLDGASGLRLLDLRDAAGPRRTPRGPVETGLGGLAGRVAPPPWTASARLLPPPSAPAEPRPADRPGEPTETRPVHRAGESVEAGPVRRAAAYADPAVLRIPAIGVRTGLERLATDPHGRLLPPRDPARAGWFGDGVRPGDTGPAVVAGHVDSRTGPAVFTRLATLRPGGRILVTDATGRVAMFTVDRVRSFPKTAFPTEEVYGATPDPQLRLITCGGAFDPVSGHYRRDVVVYASLAHEPG